jgi:hypothetical protein
MKIIRGDLQRTIFKVLSSLRKQGRGEFQGEGMCIRGKRKQGCLGKLKHFRIVILSVMGKSRE